MRKFTKLIIAFILSLGIGMSICSKPVQKVEAASPTRFYLEFASSVNWPTANADIRCYAWNASGYLSNAWPGTTMSKNSAGIYYVDLNDTPTGLQFNRLPPTWTSSMGSDGFWNKTGDLAYVDGMNCFKLDDWNSGHWKSYTSEPLADSKLSLAGSFNGWDTKDTTYDLSAPSSNVSTVTVTTTEAFKFKVVRDHSWDFHSSLGSGALDLTNSSVYENTKIYNVVNDDIIVSDKGTYQISVNVSTGKITVVETEASKTQKATNDSILKTAYQEAVNTTTTSTKSVRLLSAVNILPEELESYTEVGFIAKVRRVSEKYTVAKDDNGWEYDALTTVNCTAVYAQIEANEVAYNVSEVEGFEGFNRVFAYAIMDIPMADGNVEITFRSFFVRNGVTTYSNNKVITITA